MFYRAPAQHLLCPGPCVSHLSTRTPQPVPPPCCRARVQSMPRSKALRRQVKRALGMGKKLEEKQGQLIYKGMPG